MTKSKKLLWRSGVIGIGFLWSAVLWHQQVVVDRAAREDQERIVTTAVSQSNQHADQQIGNVREDVKGVKGDVREVKGDLATTTHDIRDALSQSGIEIGHSIEKVNKPAPPELAQLEFSFFSPNTTTFPFRTTSIIPDKDGNYPVEVYFTNMTDVTAEEIDIWLAVCDDCSFVAEPAGFDRPKGTSEQMRHLTIHGLNPGTSWERISLLVKSPIVVTPSTYFSLAFLYSCKTCGKKKPAQIAKVYGRP